MASDLPPLSRPPRRLADDFAAAEINLPDCRSMSDKAGRRVKVLRECEPRPRVKNISFEDSKSFKVVQFMCP